VCLCNISKILLFFGVLLFGFFGASVKGFVGRSTLVPVESRWGNRSRSQGEEDSPFLLHNEGKKRKKKKRVRTFHSSITENQQKKEREKDSGGSRPYQV
jgi:hypothetical protein